MTRRKTDYLWIAAFEILVAFGIPWFRWGNATTWLGLPVWLWWHIGWMGFAAIVFALFTRSAWDRGMSLDTEVRADG